MRCQASIREIRGPSRSPTTSRSRSRSACRSSIRHRTITGLTSSTDHSSASEANLTRAYFLVAAALDDAVLKPAQPAQGPDRPKARPPVIVPPFMLELKPCDANDLLHLEQGQIHDLFVRCGQRQIIRT